MTMTAAEIAEAHAELEAALAIGYLAADFISQPETLPVFKEWVKTVTSAGNPDKAVFAAKLDSETAAHLTGVLMNLMMGAGQ